MQISAVKSPESCHIKVTIDIGMDELMDNGTKAVAMNELFDAFNADVEAKDKLMLLNIIAGSKK
jgi:hypothetical protein